MLDRRKKFEFSIKSSVGQEQDWSTSQIGDTQRGPFRSWSWERASRCLHLACTKACQQQERSMVEGADMDDKEVPRFRALAARLNYLTREKARSFVCVQMHLQEYDTGGLACHETSRPIPQKERREWCRNSIGRATTPISRVTPAQTGQATVRT